MDLKKIDTISAAEKGFDHVFIDPTTKEETDLVISVYGVGSKAWKKGNAAIEAYQNKHWSKGKEPDEEVLQELFAKLVAGCTKGWKGMQEDGKDVEFTFDNAVRIYQAYPLLTKQVTDRIADVIGMLEKND